MSIWRYLNGRINFHYIKHTSWKTFGIQKYWSGRLIWLTLGKINFVLDCRGDLLKDLTTGKPE